MMSDGISDGPDGMGALEDVKEIIEQVQSTEVQDVCDIIMRKSIDSYIGKERDDLTVMAARIF
jgi:serine phosphatase RsbU (regulator of sigma subunit)